MSPQRSASQSTGEVLIPDDILDPANLPLDVMTKLMSGDLQQLQIAYLKATTQRRRESADTISLDIIDVTTV
jgi:hypothetical protein